MGNVAFQGLISKAEKNKLVVKKWWGHIINGELFSNFFYRGAFLKMSLEKPVYPLFVGTQLSYNIMKQHSLLD